MKKILLLLTLLPIMASAQTLIDGINYYLNANTKEATVTSSYPYYTGSITIPSTVTYDGITYNVTSIGEYAFNYCSDLTAVTIPKSVISLGRFIFNYCAKLNSITVESGNTKYDSRDNCNAIIETASNKLIYGCNSTVIPNSVVSIGASAFPGSGLTSITIPQSVTSISSIAFEKSPELTSISVESGHTKYDSRDNCNAIIETATNTLVVGCKSTVIPNSVTSIWHSAFSGCKNMTEINIPNSITSLGNGAFSGCSGLTSITIPNSIKSIGSQTFAKCFGLTEVYCYSESVPTTNGQAFESTNISNATLYVPAASLEAYKAIYPWNGFGNIVALDEETPETPDLNPICYEYNTSSLEATVIASDNKYTGAVTIPETVTYNGVTYKVTSIGKYAFAYCSGLTEVTISNSVTSIGEGAFGLCSGLTSVIIPNSVTCIGERAFYNCSGLTSVIIPNSITEVGESAFDGTPWYENQSDGMVYIGMVAYKYKGTMPENTSIAIREGTISIAEDAFDGCKGLISVAIPNSVTSIGESAFGFCSGLTSVTIPSSVTSIGTGVFHYCSSLTSVTIPNSVTSIGSSAFSDCSSLTSINIPNSVTSIENYAFRRCTGLTSVTIPSGVKKIDDFTFFGCSELTEIIIPNNVISIGGAAFWKCEKLTSVEIPNSVTSIGGQAFAECKSLTSITIPNSVTSIGSQAFYKSYGLTNVYCYPEEVPTTHSSAFQSVNLQNATLNVPAASVSAYKTTTPWSEFGNIVALNVEPEPTGVRGDVNGDGEVGMSDVMYIIQYILNGKFPDEE